MNKSILIFSLFFILAISLNFVECGYSGSSGGNFGGGGGEWSGGSSSGGSFSGGSGGGSFGAPAPGYGTYGGKK
ncbi:hypothetical protein ACQ4LE_001108 [Meloidogyne hapla]|uniref:Uncharacterized protein n=1 Tax=Meloidogyne hapla TaxID=6305 RepID=A0A1I8B9C5_MELHA